MEQIVIFGDLAGLGRSLMDTLLDVGAQVTHIADADKAVLRDQDTVVFLTDGNASDMDGVQTIGAALKDGTPDNRKDADGEPVAPCQIVIILDACGAKARIARSTLDGVLAHIALSLAPSVRANAIVLEPAVAPRGTAPADLGRLPADRPGIDDILSALRYLLNAQSVTGETLVLTA